MSHPSVCYVCLYVYAVYSTDLISGCDKLDIDVAMLTGDFTDMYFSSIF